VRALGRDGDHLGAGESAALWTDASIAAVVRACRTANAHRAPNGLPPVAERIFDFDGWTRLLEIGPGDDWEATHAPRAAPVVSGWRRWTAGDALVHRDIRLDNTTFDAKSGSATLLDRAYAAAGSPWIDLAQLAADIVATGHTEGPETATDRAHGLLQTLPPEASPFVVALAGMWSIRAATIPDTVMPTISAWRRTRAAALRPMLTRLLRSPVEEATSTTRSSGTSGRPTISTAPVRPPSSSPGSTPTDEVEKPRR
jgi:hypothetical protein